MRLEVFASAATSFVGWAGSLQRLPLTWPGWLLPVLNRQFDDARSDDDESPLFEKMRQGDGRGHPGSNAKQNKAFDRVAKDYGLNRDQARRLHEAISGKGYDLEVIRQIAEGMKSGG